MSPLGLCTLVAVVPLWYRGPDSGPVESCSDPCTYPVKAEVLKLVQTSSVGASGELKTPKLVFKLCPRLSERGCDFTLGCPLIGGQQPSSTVMLDFWMKQHTRLCPRCFYHLITRTSHSLSSKNIFLMRLLKFLCFLNFSFQCVTEVNKKSNSKSFVVAAALSVSSHQSIKLNK